MSFRCIKSRHISTGENDPYAVLEVPHDIDNDSLKRKYRALVAENHPDRVIARGLPEEFIELANQRLSAINAAYEELKTIRGL